MACSQINLDVLGSSMTNRTEQEQLQLLRDLREDNTMGEYEKIGNFKPSYMNCIGTTPLNTLTTGHMVDIAVEKWPDSEAVVSIYQGQRLTFKEVRDKADRLAAGLTQLGIKRGDRVGLWGHNSIEWYLTRLAVARGGFIAVQLDPAYQAPQLIYSLTKVEIKALVFSEIYKNNNVYQIICNGLPEVNNYPEGGCEIQSSRAPSLKTLIIMSDKKYKGAHQWSDVLASALPETVKKIREEQNLIQADDGCVIQFSSGTTGSPKGALLSHHNLVNNAIIFGKRFDLEETSKVLVTTQFCHTSGSLLGIIATVISGATCVIPCGVFDAKTMVEGVIKESCTLLLAIPSLFVDMIAKTKEHGLQVKTLRTACFGGAPCSPQLAMQIYETFNVKKLLPVYGMTEISMVFCSKDDDTLEQRTQTVGFITEHLEVKVVDKEGRIVPMGTPGELWIRGYCVMLGYWNDEQKTREFIGQDRWARTGDQFILHEDGSGQIVGRVKDMIIRISDNIFPAEIEEFFTNHSDIIEAQAFGVPDPNVGEEICVYLRLREGATLTEGDVREYCKDKIADYRIPRYIRFTKSFERTVIGKIQKFKLLEQLQKELGSVK